MLVKLPPAEAVVRSALARPRESDQQDGLQKATWGRQQAGVQSCPLPSQIRDPERVVRLGAPRTNSVASLHAARTDSRPNLCQARPVRYEKKAAPGTDSGDLAQSACRAGSGCPEAFGPLQVCRQGSEARRRGGGGGQEVLLCYSHRTHKEKNKSKPVSTTKTKTKMKKKKNKKRRDGCVMIIWIMFPDLRKPRQIWRFRAPQGLRPLTRGSENT